jgi:hypothetical protein
MSILIPDNRLRKGNLESAGIGLATEGADGAGKILPEISQVKRTEG